MKERMNAINHAATVLAKSLNATNTSEFLEGASSVKIENSGGIENGLRLIAEHAVIAAAFLSTEKGETRAGRGKALPPWLGRAWETMRVSLKVYSCVGSNHTTLDAIRNMQSRTPFGADDIASIVVHGSHVTVEHVGWPYQPQGLVSAQLNLPFCVATLLLEGDVFVDQFTDDVVDDKRRIELSKKVSVLEDPSITSRGSNFRHMVRVEVHLKNGVKLVQTVEAPRGSENSFASEADIVQKFKKLAAHVVSDAKTDEVVNLVLGAEKLERAEQIAQALANG